MAKIINLSECITFGVDMGSTVDVSAGYCVTPGNSAWTASVDTDNVFFVNVFDVVDGAPVRGEVGGEDTSMVAAGESVLIEITSSDFQGTFANLVVGDKVVLHSDGNYKEWTGTEYKVGVVLEKKTSTAVIQLRTGVCSYE